MVQKSHLTSSKNCFWFRYYQVFRRLWCPTSFYKKIGVSGDGWGHVQNFESFLSCFPYEKALTRALLSFNEMSMKNFLPQSIISLVQVHTEGSAAIKSTNAVMQIVHESLQLQYNFATTCVQVMNTKMGHCWSLYFRPLGYCTVCASQEEYCDVQFENTALIKWKKLYKKSAEQWKEVEGSFQRADFPDLRICFQKP